MQVDRTGCTRVSAVAELVDGSHWPGARLSPAPSPMDIHRPQLNVTKGPYTEASDRT